MSTMSFWSSIALQLAYQSPYVLVELVGLVFALVRWRLHPKASLYAVIGLGTLMFSSLGGTAAFAFLTSSMLNNGVASVSTYVMALGFARVLCSSVGLGFVVAGVFANRSRPFSLARHDDPYSPLPAELRRPAPNTGPDDAYRQSKPPNGAEERYP